MTTLDRSTHPHALKLAARITGLETKLQRLGRQWEAHGATYNPVGDFGGIRSRSQRAKNRRLDRSLNLATERSQAARDLAYWQARYRAYVAGEITEQGRKPGKPRKPVQNPWGVDHPRRIEQGLSMEGHYVLSTGARLSIWMGWDLLNRDALGLARLDYQGTCRRQWLLGEWSGSTLYDAAIALAKEHLGGQLAAGGGGREGAPLPGRLSGGPARRALNCS